MQKKVAVKLRVNLEADISTRDEDAFNIVGEIPGGAKTNEIVMIGAHFDSWHRRTGATDNGAGSAVMIEVMRILKALNLQLDRTVRIALWSGEEQGLSGPGVREGALRRPETMRLKPGAREVVGLLQSRQRKRQDPRRVPAGQRGNAADLRSVARTVP